MVGAYAVFAVTGLITCHLYQMASTQGFLYPAQSLIPAQSSLIFNYLDTVNVSWTSDINNLLLSLVNSSGKLGFLHC